MVSTKKICVIADSNEFSSAPEIIELLRSNQIPTIVEHLEIGDYHIGSYTEYYKDDIKNDLSEFVNRCYINCKCNNRNCLLSNTQYFSKILNKELTYNKPEKIMSVGKAISYTTNTTNTRNTLATTNTNTTDTKNNTVVASNSCNGINANGNLKAYLEKDLYRLSLWKNQWDNSIYDYILKGDCYKCVEHLIYLFETLKNDQKFPIKNQFCVSAIIERKKMADLFASLRDDRLWKQLINMSNASRETGVKSFLMTIGDFPTYNYFTKRKCTQKDYAYYSKTFETIELKTQLSFGVGFKQFKTLDQFISYIVKMVKCISTIGTSNRPVMSKKNNVTYEDLRSDIFCCIPDVGRTTGDTLASKHSIVDVANMSKESLADIRVGKNKRRIGEQTATLILKSLNTCSNEHIQ
jgi:ERCC4-type nuclease